MMWGQPPPTYNTADPWYDGAANYDYGAGQEVEQRWAVLDGALNSYLGGQDVPPPPPAPQYQQTQSWDEQASKNAQRWAKESSGYAAQAQAQAARLGLAAGGVGDLASPSVIYPPRSNGWRSGRLSCKREMQQGCGAWSSSRLWPRGNSKSKRHLPRQQAPCACRRRSNRRLCHQHPRSALYNLHRSRHQQRACHLELSQ